ncbi:MAG: hypothetical protein HC767_04780 [Akkermansiaceae bacterium]|nr:hypothetical protein [Akkermansiaceae bacterium]
MKLSHMIKNKPSINHYLVAGFCFIPTLLWAHPGHYHPDETDEFDTFQTLFFHSHGFLDYALAIVVLLSLTVFSLAKNQPFE